MEENADEYHPTAVFSKPANRSVPLKPPKQPPAQPPVFQQQQQQLPPPAVTPVESTPEPRVIVVENVALPGATVEDKKATCCGCLSIPPIAPTALIGISTVLAFGSGFFGSSYMSFGSGVISVIALVLQRRASMLAAIESATSAHQHQHHV